MKYEAEKQGVIEQGFQRAKDGWHLVVFCEGIEELTNADGEEIFNKRGDALWKIPMKVDDEDDESHETDIDYIVSANERGEQDIINFLGATDLFAAFAKKFKGDESIFDEPVMAKVQVKLPGQYMRIKTKQNTYMKDGEERTAVNIIGFGEASQTAEALEAALFPGKGGDDSADAPTDTDAAGAETKDDDDF